MAQSSHHRFARPIAADGFRDSALRRIVVGLIAIKLVGLCLIFDPANSDPFGVPKAEWSRALAWLILAAIVTALLRFGPSIMPRTRLHLVVMAYIAVSAAASLVAVDPYLAMFGTQNRQVGLTFLADMLVLYAAVAVAVRGRGDWLVVSGGLLVVALVAIGYGVVQYLHHDPIVWVNDLRDRPGSTFGNSGVFGEFLITVTGAAIGVGAAAGGWLRATTLSAGVVGLLGVGLAGARSSLLGLAAATIVVAALRVRAPGMPPRPRSVVWIVAFLLTSAALDRIIAGRRPGPRDSPRFRDRGSTADLRLDG